MLDYLKSFYSVEYIWSILIESSIDGMPYNRGVEIWVEIRMHKMFQEPLMLYLAEFPMPSKV